MELSINQNRNGQSADFAIEAAGYPSAEKNKVMVLFGTRPEAIKLAPVIGELKKRGFQTVVVSSSQHTDLLAPVVRLFDLEINYDLRAMRPDQTPVEVAARVLAAFDKILDAEKPDAVIVQGDTTTAFAGAFAAFNRRIKVGHVEAGLRSGNLNSPFPEEMNRRLITQATAFHFAATAGNRENLLLENIGGERIFVTGNTVVDALHHMLEKSQTSLSVKNLLDETANLKRILLTTHRRESFGDAMSGNLRVLRRFVENNHDVCLIFPVHPNPNVRRVTDKILAGAERVFLLEPLDYADFVCLMKNSWLIVSDSGGVQEEAPSLGKPLLILRENTERPEAVESGVAKLVGKKSLKLLLESNYNNGEWIESVKQIQNPFGDGKAAKRIVEILEREFSTAAENSLRIKTI